MAVSTLRQYDKLNRLARRQHWLGPFLNFIDNIRIDSKEVPAEDERGSKLHIWTSQRLFLEQLAEGLDRGQHTFLILKGRQSGISTLTLAVLLFWVAVHPRTIAALVCNEEKVRDAFRDLLKRYHESFPQEFFGEAFAKVRHNSSHFLFTNGSRIDYLIAGTRKKNWGESRGYSACLCTEVAAYGEEDGINNFIEALAQENPDRLFLFEGTAKGPNHWQEMWNDAERDEENQCRIFLGWWTKDLNRIRKNQPHYPKYAGALNGEETELCNEVLERYGHVVTMEQLAWWRWKLATSDRQSAEQNQPWTPEQAFVLSGYSFFATRLLQDRYEQVYHKPFKAYHVHIGTSFFTMRVEQVEQSADAELKIWEDPVPGAQYVIGCDPAYGHSDDSDSHCLDAETEILTDQGWKRHDQIQVGDQAVCFDPDTAAYSYGSILRKIERDVDEDLYHFEGRGADILVTADHRMVYRYRYGPGGKTQLTGWGVDTAREVSEMTHKFIHCPSGRAPCGAGIAGLSLEMCRVIGWVATDGHIRRAEYVGTGERRGQKPRNRYVHLAQAVTTTKAGVNVADEMEWVVGELFPSVSFRRRPCPGGRQDALFMRIGVRQGADRIVKWFDDAGRLDRKLITDTSPEQLSALFQGMLEGDGSCQTGSTRWAKLCPGYDKALADDMQEIALRLGHRATINQRNGVRVQPGHDQYLVHLSSGEHRRIQFKGTVPYRGKVWCVTVPTGAFVARRNGAPFVTGNCVSIWRCYADRLVQVAEYNDNRPETKHCAWVLAGLAGAYRNSVVNLELYGPGRTVMNELDNVRLQLQAEMYKAQMEQNNWDEDFMAGVRWFMYRRNDSPGPGFIYNFETSAKSKMMLFNGFRDGFTSNLLEINSARCIEEMNNMVQEKGDIAPAAPGRQHDDRPFAAALAYFAWDSVVCGALRASLIAAGATYERVSAAERGENVGGQAIVDRLVYNYFARAEAEAEERELAGPWAHEDNPDPFLLSAAGWRARRGLA